MEMLNSLEALAGKISPQSGTDSNANKVTVHNNNNNNNSSPHPHPYHKQAPATSSATASPSVSSDSKHAPANGSCSSPDILARPKNRMAFKSQSCTSVYYEPIIGEHLCDPQLVELFLERRREQCLELLEECVVLFGDKIECQYETVRDCLVDLMDDLRDGYDAAYMFPGEEASRQLQRLSPPPCSPLDQLFFRTYNKLQECSRLLFLIYEHVWDFYSSVSNRRPQDIPYTTPLEAANNQPWVLLKVSLQVAEIAKLLEFYQEVKERDLLMQSLLYDYAVKNKQWIFKRNKCKTS